MLQSIGLGKYYLDYGPVQMTISAFAGDRALDVENLQVERYVHELLENLKSCLDVAKQPLTVKNDKEDVPQILSSMIAALKAAGDSTLTPMAAVAGAFADAVADFLVKQNATRVIVNNGGDISLRLTAEDSAVVGLHPELEKRYCSHTFRIDGNSNYKGIATSGLGGRGFTRGIASAVTVLAENSCVADACATSIANHSTIDDPAVIRLPAGLLDPNSDIKEYLVTIECSSLQPQAYYKAMQGGIEQAKKLINENVIMGAAIYVGPYLSILPESFAAKIEHRKGARTSVQY